MEKTYGFLPRIPVHVRCKEETGVFGAYKHSIGHGGINNFPLPPKVQRGLAACKPRLVRTFIQEYFNVYPAHDTYDWSLLDPYMDSLASSGAKVVASLCIKPSVLYPAVNQFVVMPTDIAEWQRVVETLVRRYSVEKEIVTHWEISNESDIGENGGCPFWTKTPEEYNAYYKITAEAILRAFPQAKVGGPVVADVYSLLVEGLMAFCRTEGIQLDFVSWHRYSDNPDDHTAPIRHVRTLLDKYFGADRPEMMITEFGKGFDDVCVEESAFDSFRPAVIGASILDMMDTEVDWTFYYHVWDQVFVAEQFRLFYEDPEIMLLHWNKIPHRMGLFGVCGEVRPAYFLYRLLSEMGDAALAAESGAQDVRVKAARDEAGVTAVLVNHDPRCPRDLTVQLYFDDIPDGLKLLTVYKLDGSRNWDEDSLEIHAAEKRFVDTSQTGGVGFYCNVFCPADSAAFVRLETVDEAQIKAFYSAL